MSNYSIINNLKNSIEFDIFELRLNLTCINNKDKDCDEFEVMRHKLFWDLHNNLPRYKMGHASKEFLEHRKIQIEKAKQKLQEFDDYFGYVHNSSYECFH